MKEGFGYLTYEESLRRNIAIGDCCKLSVVFGEGCETLPKNNGFNYLIHELIANCAEKCKQEIKIDITASYDSSNDKFHLKVEDNVLYTQEELEALLKNLSKKKVKRMNKTIGRELIDEPFGIIYCRTILKRWGGDLSYKANTKGGITAVAWWQGKLFSRFS